MRKVFVVTIILLIASGCQKRLSNPEMVDPIYNDLRSRLADAQTTLSTAQTQLQSDKSALAPAKPQTGERARAMSEIARDQLALAKAKQNAEYLKIKVQARLVYSQKTYNRDYKEKKAWPDKKEWREYQAHRELVLAPRTWDQHLKNEGINSTGRPAKSKVKKSKAKSG